jgi:predicted nucleic acid-binding protein
MAGERFLDTNILIYAFAADDPRSAQAEALLAQGGVVGVQVINEFISVARRKLGWDWPQIDSALEVIEELAGPARPLTREIHREALLLARNHPITFYDALIVAAAADAGCRVVVTEDMQHGRRLGGVTLHNPFTATLG